MSVNQAKDMVVNLDAGTLGTPRLTQETIGLAQTSPQFFIIPEEGVSNVKDCMISRLPTKEKLSGEACGSGGQLVM